MVLSLPYRILIIWITVFGLFLGGYWMGKSDEREDQQVKQLAQERAANAKYHAEVDRGNALAAQLESTKAQTRTVTKTITREVNHYVTPLSISHCTIPLGFVRLHDAAAANRMPEAPDVDVDAPGGVDLAAVAATVAENYGECNAWREQLNALIDFEEGRR